MLRADADLLYRHVEFMTQIRPFRNYQNRESLRKVAAYVQAEFQKYGLAASEQQFRAEGHEYQNVLATYQPAQQRRLIVGAHYDVCGDQPGADDNASAVAGLLETARLVAAAQPAVDYRIDFVAYCLEEPPFFGTEHMGSFIHAESIRHLKPDIIGVINYEMIGYFHDGRQPFPDAQLAANYPAIANFIMVVGKQRYHQFNRAVYEKMRVDAQIDVQILDHPALEHLAGLSDQRSYWEFDIPALMINDTSFVRNPHYHLMSDDIDTLDFAKMAEVVNCTYRAVVGF